MACCVSYLFSLPKEPHGTSLCGSTHNVIFLFLTKENASLSWISDDIENFLLPSTLESRVGCWKNFCFTILQKVLLQLHNSFKARYFPVFVRCFQHAQTDVHGVPLIFFRFHRNPETTQNTFQDWLAQFCAFFSDVSRNSCMGSVKSLKRICCLIILSWDFCSLLNHIIIILWQKSLATWKVGYVYSRESGHKK